MLLEMTIISQNPTFFACSQRAERGVAPPSTPGAPTDRKSNRIPSEREISMRTTSTPGKVRYSWQVRSPDTPSLGPERKKSTSDWKYEYRECSRRPKPEKREARETQSPALQRRMKTTKTESHSQSRAPHRRRPLHSKGACVPRQKKARDFPQQKESETRDRQRISPARKNRELPRHSYDKIERAKPHPTQVYPKRTPLHFHGQCLRKSGRIGIIEADVQVISRSV